MTEQVATWIKEALAQNELAQGGLIVAIVSFLIHWSRGLPGQIWGNIKRLVSCEFEVSEENLVFQNLAIWARSQESIIRTYRYTVHNDAKHIFPVGSSIFIRKGWRIYKFYVSRDKVESTGIDKMFYLTAYLSVFPGGRKHIQGILDEAAQVFKQITETHMTVRISYGYGWRSIDGVAKRYRDTVFIPGHIKEDLIKDGQEFLKSAEWYRAKGVPWRRGYLLYGPTGTGKTTLVKCLATELRLPLYIIQLGKTTSDSELSEMMGSAPSECILLLEDIDCAVRAAQQRNDTEDPPLIGDERLTLSGLLNAIDGCATQEGRILIMTTNYPDTLDPALLRDGRADIRVEIPPADQKVLRDIFLHFFPDEEQMAELFSNTPLLNRPTAEIQGHLLRYKDDPAQALQAAQQLPRT